MAQHIFQHTASDICQPNGTKETIEVLLNGPSKIVWEKSLSNERERLDQGNMHGVKSLDTINFIHNHKIPQDRDITYATYVLDYRQLKSEPYPVRITVGDNRLSYDDDAYSPAANLLEIEVLLNSTILDAPKGVRFMTADIKYYFLATPMAQTQYMKVKYKHIPEDIKQKYILQLKVTVNNYIYIRIKRKCMASSKRPSSHMTIFNRN